jgi:hypothetical protein
MNTTRNKYMTICVLAAILCCGPTLGAKAAVVFDLFDWGINSDSTTYTPSDALPGSINTGGFDFTTGLGTITASFGAPGAHYFSLFVDHEIDEAVNTFFNEYGGTSLGAPAAGQSWEIDEPGFVFGDIYTHFLARALDNANGVPAGAPDDVSMAQAWDFFLGADETGLITMQVGLTPPPSGFYLTQTDPDSQASIYFSSRLTVRGGDGTVPDGGSTLACLSLALAGLAGLRRKL